MKYILEYNSFLINESSDYALLSGIKQDDILTVKKDIIDTLLPLLLLSEDDIFFAGSSGKRKDPEELSKNINIILDLNSFLKSNNIQDDHIQFFNDQIKRLNYNSTQGDENTIFIDWPFNDTNIETIIHISNNFDWIKFTRYCPDISKNESEYEGKYREAIFSAIVESINKKIISYDDENDNVREYSTLVFDRNNGLFRILKSFSGPNGTLSKAYEVKGSRKLITTDPDKFVNIIFGEDYKKEDLMTFENILEIIKDHDFKYYNKLEQIKSRFYKKVTNLNLSPITI